MKDEIKEIREYISCPQFGDDHYGKWGALRLEQRKKIKDLLDYITNLQEENEKNKNYSDFYKDMSDKWKDMSDVFKKSCEDYKQRIDKAVEYINKYEYQKYCPSPYEKDKYIMREEKEGQDLLDILRGDE